MNARLTPISQADRFDALIRSFAVVANRLDRRPAPPHIIASAIARLGLVIAISALAIVIAVVAG